MKNFLLLTCTFLVFQAHAHQSLNCILDQNGKKGSTPKIKITAENYAHTLGESKVTHTLENVEILKEVSAGSNDFESIGSIKEWNAPFLWRRPEISFFDQITVGKNYISQFHLEDRRLSYEVSSIKVRLFRISGYGAFSSKFYSGTCDISY